MIRFAGILRRMNDDDRRPERQLGKILVTVRDGPRFPAELWSRFKEAAKRKDESWIDALRRIVERYTQE